jgi:hypothetical protein
MEIEHDNIPPGTKAALSARNGLFRSLISGEFVSVLSWKETFVIWLFLTWLWIVNFGAVIWLS